MNRELIHKISKLKRIKNQFDNGLANLQETIDWLEKYADEDYKKQVEKGVCETKKQKPLDFKKPPELDALGINIINNISSALWRDKESGDFIFYPGDGSILTLNPKELVEIVVKSFPKK